MKWTLVVVFAICLTAVAGAQHTPDPGTNPNGAVQATGCVKPGVENECTTLKDKKTGNIYTLFFTGDAPPPNTGISFEATTHQGTTTCMQGTAVNVSHWNKVKMRCSKSKTAPAAPAQ